MTEKYNASNVSLEQILSYIKSGEIAIPDHTRNPTPFCVETSTGERLNRLALYGLSYWLLDYFTKPRHEIERRLDVNRQEDYD